LQDFDFAQKTGDELAFDEMGMDDFDDGNPACAHVAREEHRRRTADAKLIIEPITAFNRFAN